MESRIFSGSVIYFPKSRIYVLHTIWKKQALHVSILYFLIFSTGKWNGVNFLTILYLLQGWKQNN